MGELFEDRAASPMLIGGISHVGVSLFSPRKQNRKGVIMKRNCRIWARLSPEEMESLNQKAKSTGLSREEYIRKVLAGAVPKQAPPLEYAELLRELRRRKL